jgi:hypothetical protein
MIKKIKFAYVNAGVYF